VGGHPKRKKLKGSRRGHGVVPGRSAPIGTVQAATSCKSPTQKFYKLMLKDITRCHGTGCPIKQQCLRHTAPIPDNTLLSWAANLNHERAHICAYYMPATPELSPTARAVFEAFNSRFEWIEDGVPAPQFKALAAALRAAANQVVPEIEILPQQDLEDRREAMEWGMKNQTQLTRQQLFAVAAELEAQ